MARIPDHQSHYDDLDERVAAIEVDLRNVISSVKGVSEDVRALAASVVKASSPRPTNWGTIIAACALILGIGNAVFWPLDFRMTELKSDQNKLEEAFSKHAALPLHPVGESRMNAIENDLRERSRGNSERIKELDAKITKETETADRRFDEKLADIRRDLEEVKGITPGAMAKLASIDLRLQILERGIILEGKPKLP